MSGAKGSKPGVYLIVIDGLPELYTWQDLKDFVRPEAEHEFWADLQSIPNGAGQKRGCVRTQRPKEAEHLYQFLTRATVNGRRLGVVLWDISQSPPRQMAPNPSRPISEAQTKWASAVAGGNHAFTPIVLGVGSHQQTPRHAPRADLVQSMGALSLQQRQQQQAAFYAQQQQQQKQVEAARQSQQPQAAYYAAQVQPPPRYDTPRAHSGASRSPAAYINSQTGTPVNVRDGVALTVSRGVFVSGLNYKAREQDIKHKFGSVGEVVKCSLHTDPTTGKSKGVATILYTTADEAQKAVRKYHDATWMDKKIKVRIDKEATTLAAPPRLDTSPLIVNGSGVQ